MVGNKYGFTRRVSISLTPAEANALFLAGSNYTDSRGGRMFSGAQTRAVTKLAEAMNNARAAEKHKGSG